MPRSRRGGAAPSRPAAAPSRPTAAPARPAAPMQQQSRPASTATAPARTPQQQAPPQQQAQSGGSGLFGQMASTAAGVAVGSSIGHAIGGFFGGGSSSAPAPEAQQAPVADYNDGYSYRATATDQNSASQGPCAGDIKMFTQCMDQNQGDLNICGWYMDQLKACQQASKNY
ncbi:MAG: hypothetical protein Q9160_006056 [Pyrenula sp. 1 TL-2023]